MTSSDVNIIFEEEPVEITLNEDPVEIEMPAGQNGQSLRPRGAWSSSESYGYLDLVSYQGSSYVATKTVPVGALPTDTGFWMLSAEKGLDGASEWGDIGGDIADQTDLAQALAGKANVGDSYTKAETDTLLADKADADDVYTKSETDSLLSDKADSADVYTKTETDALLQDKAPVILSSASGSIASFTDGSPAPVTALSVGIEPVQDLHGYDNPWPAGGGVNLLPTLTQEQSVSQNGLTVTYKTNGAIVISGQLNSGTSFFNNFALPLSVDVDTSLFIQYLNSSTSSNISVGFRNSNNTSITASTLDNNNKIVQFTGSGTVVQVSVFINSTAQFINFTLYPMITKNNSPVASYSPYSNICPISGWTSATVTRTGKNLLIKSSLAEPWDGVAGNNFTRIAINNYTQISLYGTDGLHFKTGTAGNAGGNGVGFKINLEQFGIKIGDVVTFSASIKGTVTGSTSTGWKYYHSVPSSNTYYAASVNFYNIQNFSSTSWQRVSGSFTVADTGQGSNKGYAYIIPSIGFNAELYVKDIQLEFGSVANPYEDNNKVVLTIDLDGTRYGGTLDVLTGEMTVTHGITDLGNYNYTYQSNNSRFISTTQVIGMKYTINDSTPFNGVCSAFPIISANKTTGSSGDSLGVAIAYTDSVLRIRYRDSGITDPSAFKASMSGVQLVYELASPFTVQLTPAQMQTLLGENHIFADTGDVEVTYRADTKLFIQEQIAQSETLTRKMIADSATADGKAPKSLAKSDLIIVGDELRKATANIGNGSAITASNSTTATLADVIKALQ